VSRWWRSGQEQASGSFSRSSQAELAVSRPRQETANST